MFGMDLGYIRVKQLALMKQGRLKSQTLNA